jgi:hypothetical protein
MRTGLRNASLTASRITSELSDTRASSSVDITEAYFWQKITSPTAQQRRLRELEELN